MCEKGRNTQTRGWFTALAFVRWQERYGTVVLSISHATPSLDKYGEQWKKNCENMLKSSGKLLYDRRENPIEFLTRKTVHICSNTLVTTISPSNTVGRYEIIVMFTRGPYIMRSGYRGVFTVAIKTSLTGYSPYKISGKML